MGKTIKELCEQYVARWEKNYSKETLDAAFNKALIGSAQMYALKCISIEDVCCILKCKKIDLPKEFYWYVKLYGIKYDTDRKLKALTEDINKQV